jgi:hypothetical protein
VATEATPSLFSAGEMAEKPGEGVTVWREGGDPDESISRDRPRSGALRDVGVLLEQREDAGEGGGAPGGRLPGGVALLAGETLVAGEMGRIGRQVRGDNRTEGNVVSQEKSQGTVGGRVMRKRLVQGRVVPVRAPAEG